MLVLAGRVDIKDFTRDVVVKGDRAQKVPGRVAFRVIESLSSAEETMTVGIALSGASADLDCAIETRGGRPVQVRPGTGSDTFADSGIKSSWKAVVVAEDLPPGDYVAECERSGESSTTQPRTFAVGRVVTGDDLLAFAGPALWALAAAVVGAVIALVGLILLIVGLVRGKQAREAARQPPPWRG